MLEPWLQVDPEAVLPGVGRVHDLLAALREAEAEADADGTSAPEGGAA